MKRIDTGYKFPNGIAVQYDKTGTTPENLIVAETPTKTLWSFPFIKDSPGSVDVSKKSVFGHLRGWFCVTLLNCRITYGLISQSTLTTPH